MENQYTIGKWATETFGPPSSPFHIAARANKEMAELLDHLSTNRPKSHEEVADVVIVLFHLANAMEFDLQTEINRKMSINRSRQWVKDGQGCGQHV